MKWLNFASKIRGTVEAIYLTDTAGSLMRFVSEAEALTGAGLKGDRYAVRAGYWAGTDACQVTLIAAEDLDAITRATDLKLQAGEHRRNIVTRGLVLTKLKGKTFRVGTAVFEYRGPRPPCSHLESLTQPGIVRALARAGGICARVIEPGTFRVRDTIEIL